MSSSSPPLTSPIDQSNKPVTNKPIHFDTNKGIIFTFDDSTTYFGVGTLPEEQDYPLISDTTQRDNPLLKFYAPSVTTLRNASFIYNPQLQTVIYFEDKVKFDEDTDDFRKSKIAKVLEKIKAFDILPDKIVLVSLDTPSKTGSQSDTEYFHKDTIALSTVNPFIQITLLAAGNNVKGGDNIVTGTSEYTIIEYGSDCVSTTLRNPLTDKDFFRFWACPGTNLCVNNRIQEHSTPWSTLESGTVNRDFGNKMIIESVQTTGRKLYRTQITSITPEKFEEILTTIHDKQIATKELLYTDYDLSTITAQLDSGILPIFEKMSLREYLQTARAYEVGGINRRKMNNTNKTKKSKKTNIKSKKARKTNINSKKARKTKNKTKK